MSGVKKKLLWILAGGTGHPYFTTDTTAALRACEIGAGAVLRHVCDFIRPSAVRARRAVSVV